MRIYTWTLNEVFHEFSDHGIIRIIFGRTGVENMEKLALILLAAGDSRRFQGNKLLHLFHGKPMYQYLVDELEQVSGILFDQKIVVTQYREIMEDLEGRGYRVVENHESGLGISHSIELGILAAEERGDCGFCFAVCDQPYLKGETVRKLVAEFRQSGKGIGCLTCQGELGNPAVFARRYSGELLALEGDVGGRRVIRNHPGDLYLCEVEDGRELVDVDVKEY